MDKTTTIIEANEAKIQKHSERLYETYTKQFDLFEKTPIAKLQGGLTSYNIWELGRQLEQWDELRAVCEVDSSINNLGALPKIAHDVITLTYGTSAVTAMAVTQPLADEFGNVYYKTVKAVDVKGNIVAANTEIHKHGETNLTLQSYASDQITAEAIGTGDGSTVTFAGTLAAPPIRKESLSFAVADSTVTAADDGLGVIRGNGAWGTINYSTGVYSITYGTAPASTKAITAAYLINMEEDTDIPEIQIDMANKPVKAKVYALKSTTGMIQKLLMSKRFGLDADQEAAKDLIHAINAEVSGELIKAFNTNVQGNTAYDRAAPSAVSEFEHLQALKFRIEDAQSTLVTNAKMGAITVLIGGPKTVGLLSTLPGYKVLSNARSVGASIHGELDGRLVIRVIDPNILTDGTLLCIWKGETPFEGAGYNAPLFPLATTGVLPLSPNPLTNQQAAAVMTAVGVLNENFITKITISNL
jgi:hypothetical protein